MDTMKRERHSPLRLLCFTSGAVGEHHGSWGAGKCRSTQGWADGEFSDQEQCLRLALPSAGSAVGGRLDWHRADSRRGPWRRLSGGELGPWAHPSGTSRENGLCVFRS